MRSEKIDTFLGFYSGRESKIGLKTTKPQFDLVSHIEKSFWDQKQKNSLVSLSEWEIGVMGDKSDTICQSGTISSQISNTLC